MLNLAKTFHRNAKKIVSGCTIGRCIGTACHTKEELKELGEEELQVVVQEEEEKENEKDKKEQKEEEQEK